MELDTGGEKITFCPKCGKSIQNTSGRDKKQMDSSAKENDRQCPSCGLLFKVDSKNLTECPVCGEKLPDLEETTKAQDKRPVYKEKSISLEKVLIKKGINPVTWNLREILNVVFLSFMITSIIKYFLLVPLIDVESGEEIPLNPAFELLFELATIMIGIVPILYIKLTKHEYTKLGFKKLKNVNILKLVVLVVAGGIGLILLNLLSDLINASIYHYTQLDIFSTSQNEMDFNNYLKSNPFYLILFSIAYGASLSFSEILLRGTITNGLKDHFKKKSSSNVYLVKTLLLSTLFATLVDLAIVFLNPKIIVFALFSNFVLGLIFLMTREIYTVIVLRILYVVIIILLFYT